MSSKGWRVAGRLPEVSKIISRLLLGQPSPKWRPSGGLNADISAGTFSSVKLSKEGLLAIWLRQCRTRLQVESIDWEAGILLRKVEPEYYLPGLEYLLMLDDL